MFFVSPNSLTTEQKKFFTKKILTWLLFIIALYATSIYSYLLFHTVAELLSIVVGATLFLITWNSRKFVKNNYLLFIGIAYLFISFLDLIHTLSYKGMTIFLDYSYYANQLWIAARYLEAISLFLGFHYLSQKKEVNYYAIFGTYFLATALILLSIFRWKIFPVCFIEGQGLTQFKKISEYIICFILFLNILLLARNKKRFEKNIVRLLAGSLFCTIVAELAFTFYISNYGFSNLIGHYFKIFSVYFIYEAILVTCIQKPYDLLFLELKKSTQSLEKAQEIAQLGNWEWEKDHILNISDEIYRIFDIEKNNFLPNLQLFKSFVHPDDEVFVGNIIDQTTKPEKQYDFEHRIITRKKEERTIHQKGMIYFNKAGEVIRIAGTVQNITSQKKIKEELRKAKNKAERANKAKTLFLANMSHEIRTPMNALIGLSELMLESHLTVKQRDYTNKMHNAASSLLNIIDDILDLSKIEAGKLLIESSEFEIPRLIQIIRDIFDTQFRAKNLTFEITVDPELPTVLQGDGLRIRQILINLIGNSLKFTKSGKVSLAINLKEKKEKLLRVTFSVTDTGIGIKQDRLPKLFNSFVQENPSTSREFGGTGLGLSISNKLVTLMGGKLEAKSTIGKGSKFSFELTLAPESASSKMKINKDNNEDQHDKFLLAESKNQTTLQLEDVHVLLVDDNNINILVAKEKLQSAGATVDYAMNGKEALQLLSRIHYDIVFMDIQMPEMDGYATTKEIRKDPKLKNIPIIAMTAHAFEDDVSYCLSVGMNGHLSKPFKTKKICDTIMTHLDKKPSTRNIHESKTIKPKALEAIPTDLEGIDIPKGIENLEGNSDLYYEILQEFYKAHKNTSSNIRGALRANDKKTTQMLVHKLKGVSGNIQATQLFTTASELEEHLLSTNGLLHISLFDTLHSDLDTVLQTISSLDLAQKQKATSESETIFSHPELIDNLERLLTLVRENNFSAKINFQKIKYNLANTDLKSRIENLEHTINNFDFHKAEEIITDMISTTKSARTERI